MRQATFASSTIFPGTTRDYFVYVPQQYDPAKPACLMVFFDGAGFVKADGQFRVPVVFDNLIAKKQMPVTIVVAVNPGMIPPTLPGAKARSNRSFEYDSLGDANARFLLDEYHADGLRHDQVSVIDHDGAPHGWRFCQDLTATLHAHQPGVLHHAEYWNVNPYVVKAPPDGAGFDTTLTDGLRVAIRDVIGNASAPDERPLNMSGLARSLWPEGFREQWRFVQGPENHDIVYRDREQRIARLGDPANPRSWFARSRARVATGLSLTAPGIPMLFMGQEFLEDKQWSDDFVSHHDLLLNWAGLDRGDKQMLDHVRFTRELLAMRRDTPGLRGQGFRALHAHDQNRVLAFHRWVEGEGHDVMVVVHLAPFNRFDYRIGFPGGGEWREVFNSDVYENWVNPGVIGNGERVVADPHPLHGFGHSAALVLPANSLLIFSR